MESKENRGFTLVELLVVVAVLALLASIVFSNLGGAREGARISNALSFESQTHSLLGSDLVGWWKFDDNLNDTSGYGNNGTWGGAGSPIYVDGVPGKSGKATEFNGSSDYVQISSSLGGTLDGIPGASLSMWIRLNSDQNSAANSGIIQLSGYDSSNGNLYYYTDSSRDGGIWLDIFRTNRVFTGDWQPTFPGTAWHNLAVTTTPGANGWKMYLNGILRYQTTGESSVSVNSSLFGGFRIGQNSGGRQLGGRIDDVRIYSRALTSGEIDKIYAGTKYKYLAENND